MVAKGGITYADLGVAYDDLDLWKRECQAAGRGTAGNLTRHGCHEVEWSRGESVYLIEGSNCYYGHVEEGLGTKNLVADAMYALTGRSYYDCIAQDVVATIVNDMATLGVAPVSVALHMAAGHSDWFKDKQRRQDFVRGFEGACNMAGAVWGPGESPALREVILPETVEISGSAFGVVTPKERLIVPGIRGGDAIVLVESSGIHANGLTLARDIANRLNQDYLTPVDEAGTTYGAALLVPAIIYTQLVEALLDARVKIDYIVNITGHGWRKLMRSPKPFAYIIETIPEPPAIFKFIQEHGPVTDIEAYGNLNMGAGFAFYVPPDEVEHVCTIAESFKLKAWKAGVIEPSLERKVIIREKNIVYTADTLSVR